MALCQVNFFSQALSRQVSVNVIVPEGRQGPFATLYLLHGLSDDHTIWLRRTRVEAYAETLPLIVVLPDAMRGYYTNHHDGPPHATYMAEELPRFIERTFPARTEGQARCVGGISMGGYGALRLGLGYPGRYVSITSHAGALMITHPGRASSLSPDEYQRIFGPSPANSEHDLPHLARQVLSQGKLPAIRFDCGLDDPFLNENRRFSVLLQEMGAAHEYEEFPGGHNWDYAEARIGQALQFHAKALGL